VSQPQEIIVYRNPVEYQLYNSELVFPLMVAAVVAVVVTVLVGKVQSYFTGNFVRSLSRAKKNGPLARLWSDIRNHFGQYLCLYAGAIAAVATFVKMTNV
jgi:hypothetical protein